MRVSKEKIRRHIASNIEKALLNICELTGDPDGYGAGSMNQRLGIVEVPRNTQLREDLERAEQLIALIQERLYTGQYEAALEKI